MPSVKDAVAGSHTCPDSAVGSGSETKIASGECSGSGFVTGSGFESVISTGCSTPGITDGGLGSGSGVGLAMCSAVRQT